MLMDTSNSSGTRISVQDPYKEFASWASRQSRESQESRATRNNNLGIYSTDENPESTKQSPRLQSSGISAVLKGKDREFQKYMADTLMTLKKIKQRPATITKTNACFSNYGEQTHS